MRIVGHHALDGAGDCMHVNVADGIAYVGHMGESRVGTSILDVSDPTNPRLLHQIQTPIGTHSHKVQIQGDVLVVNYERNALLEKDATTWEAGLKTFDVSDPANPKPLGMLPMRGKGVHRMTYWEAPYAFMSGSDDGYTNQFLIIADLTDPSAPREVARWWIPGMHEAGGEVPDWDPQRLYKAHHAIVRGNRAYCTWWDAGYFILDISDIEKPELVTHHFFGGDSFTTHTAMPVPGKDLLVVVEESTHDECDETPKHARIVDISDERNPVVLSQFPVPEGDFCSKGGRFGPHNIHEAKPGTLIDPDTVYMTYFNAGVRVFDISDPTNPVEKGHCIPVAAPGAKAIQMNDLTVDTDGLIYATDRKGGGLYVMEYDGSA